jgi:hypothetical protein
MGRLLFSGGLSETFGGGKKLGVLSMNGNREEVFENLKLE